VLLVGVEGRAYGLDVGHVREILRFRAPTRLPGAPAHVLGLINMRGLLVPVIDLARRLHGTASNPHAASIVLVEHGARAVGVTVAEVHDVVPLDDAACERAAGAGEHGIAAGVARVRDGAVVLLDVSAIVREVLNSADGDTQ
jgi:purine-binding chemotaxis protein CheW